MTIYTTRPNHFRTKARARLWLRCLLARVTRWTLLFLAVLVSMVNF